MWPLAGSIFRVCFAQVDHPHHFCFVAFTFPLDGLFNVRAFWRVLPTACFAALFRDLPNLPVCDGSLLLNRDVSHQSSALVGTWSREAEMSVAGV